MKTKACLILLILAVFSTSACNDSNADISAVSHTGSFEKQFNEEQFHSQIPEGYIASKILKETPDGYYALCIDTKEHHFSEGDSADDKDSHDALGQNMIFFITGDEAKAVWTGNCLAAAIDSQDQLFVLSEEKKDNEINYILDTYDRQFSKINSVKLKSPPKEHSILVNDIAVYSDRFSVIRVGGIQIFDLSGKILFEKTYKSINNFTSDDKNLYLTEYPVFGGETNRLFQFDVFELKEKWSTDIQLIQDQIKLLSYNPYDSKLYFILNNRLMTCEKDKLTEVCNFLSYKSGRLIADSAVSDDKSRVINYLEVLFQSKDRFSLTLFSMEGNYSFTYTLAEMQSGNKSENVNVLLPVHNNALEMAAARFENKNADIKINFNFHKEKGDISQPEFVQFLNLKVLSGEQDWDIVPVNFLPYWQYIRKGVLKDISSLDINNELADSNKYYVNLIDGCKVDNKLYYLPIYITFQSFLVDINRENAEKIIQTSKYWTWKDLQQIVTSWTNESKPFGKHPFHSTAISSMIYKPYISGFFTGEEKEADTKLFEECLSLLGEFEEPSLYSDVDGTMTALSGTQWSMFLYNMLQFSEDLRVLPVPVLQNSGRRSFEIQEAYAINSKSSNPSAAFAFLKFLAQDSSWGYPGAIVKADREYIINAMSDKFKISAEKVTPFVDSLLQTKESLNYAEYFDVEVGKIVYGIVDQYRKGSISKEEAARDISQRVWLYANE